MGYDAIVIGAGAAGMMCAIEAGKRGRKVLVLEHGPEIGRKIAISGGGRCNFTNLRCGPENFISSNPHFAKSALARYRPADFIALVTKHGIAYHEKALGQLFCDRSAHDVIRLLRAEAEAAGVTVCLNRSIRDVRKATEFVVETDGGPVAAAAVVIACGGLSIPKIGATDLGYRVAKRFGMRILPLRPGLVPLTFDPREAARYGDLAGVSAEVVASTGKRGFREKMLFTHRGLSGPAILQISSYWDGTAPISIDLLPGTDLLEVLLARKGRQERATTKTIVSEFLPRRLAERWFEVHVEPKPVGECSNAELSELAAGLHQWRICPDGTEGFQKAEVTAGGIHPSELSSKTMETRNVPGLYFIGEVVDVTGWLGGYNFQWAWSSGFAAGQAI